jgi:hypothetical protein
MKFANEEHVVWNDLLSEISLLTSNKYGDKFLKPSRPMDPVNHAQIT